VRRRGRVILWRSGWLQAGGLAVGWWVCDRLVRALALPVPGGVLGLALVLGLLLSGWLPLNLIRRGAGGLLDHMVLFFVPAVMALLNHPEWLSLVGLKILLVIALSTLAVMVGTAWVVELCFRWRTDHGA
jgi:holin-like protein